MNTRPYISRPRFLPLIAALLAAFPMVAGAEIAGRFQFVGGDVRVIDTAGRERAPKKGDDLHEGDTIVTAPSASAQVLMIDKGFLAVRPDTRLKVDTFKYAGKEDGTERGFFSLLRGGFRAITGAVGNLNKQNYVIKTPAATIGIRGTDHEPMYIAPPLPGERPLGPPGAYDKVNVGAAFIRTEQGTANVGPNQVGYAAGGNTAPTVLTTLPAFYKATPAPEARKQEEKKEAKGAAPGTTAGKAKAADTSTSNGAAATEITTATTGETATTATGAEPIRTTTSTDSALLGPVATTTGTAPTTSSIATAHEHVDDHNLEHDPHGHGQQWQHPQPGHPGHDYQQRHRHPGPDHHHAGPGDYRAHFLCLQRRELYRLFPQPRSLRQGDLRFVGQAAGHR